MEPGSAPAKARPRDEDGLPLEEVLQPHAIPISPPASAKLRHAKISPGTEQQQKEERARKAVASTLNSMKVASARKVVTARKSKRQSRVQMPKHRPANHSSPQSTGKPSNSSESKNLRDAFSEAAEAERKEIEELRSLLSKTSYKHPPGSFRRVGDVATNSLRKLDDGQSDSVAVLRARLQAEEHEAAMATGRPRWDNSVLVYTPAALKGCNPVTTEPWASDGRLYRQSLKAAQTIASDKPRHEIMIESAMQQYRASLGTVGETPVSARMQRAWLASGFGPSMALISGRAHAPKTPRLSKEPSPHYNPGKAAAVKDATAARKARIAARSGPMQL